MDVILQLVQAIKSRYEGQSTAYTEPSSNFLVLEWCSDMKI